MAPWSLVMHRRDYGYVKKNAVKWTVAATKPPPSRLS